MENLLQLNRKAMEKVPKSNINTKIKLELSILTLKTTTMEFNLWTKPIWKKVLELLKDLIFMKKDKETYLISRTNMNHSFIKSENGYKMKTILNILKKTSYRN